MSSTARGTSTISCRVILELGCSRLGHMEDETIPIAEWKGRGSGVVTFFVKSQDNEDARNFIYCIDPHTFLLILKRFCSYNISSFNFIHLIFSFNAPLIVCFLIFVHYFSIRIITSLYYLIPYTPIHLIFSKIFLSSILFSSFFNLFSRFHHQALNVAYLQKFHDASGYRFDC